MQQWCGQGNLNQSPRKTAKVMRALSGVYWRAMRISYIYGGQLNIFERPIESVTIGRRPPGAASGPDIDLNPDFTVSRNHARLWRDDEGRFWIEDSGSTHGTQINGQEARGAGPREVCSRDRIQIGETLLQIESAVPMPSALTARPVSQSVQSVARPAAQLLPTADIAGEVASELRASSGDELLSSAPSDTMRRMGLIFDLMLQCGTATQLDELLQQMIERLVEMIPDAERGALLLHERANDTLLLKAFSVGHSPVVSETLARRAMQSGTGFIWTRRPDDDEPGASIARFNIQTALYAPLMWQGQALGVLCVDNPGLAAFTADDLRLLMTAAHFLALALANQHLQEELRRESAIKANLLRQFPPQMAEQLLAHGKPQLSGERSEVTILSCDIRGFTQITQAMQPIDVMEMLNDYFSRLTPLIFAHNGMVDKYIGDAILAVFGIPQKDPEQHLNALRAARAMQEEMVKSNRARAAKGRVTCHIGIGIHSGEVLHGIIGPSEQIQTTVIGDTVNRATRYGDGAKADEILLSPQVYQWVWKQIEVEPTSIDTKHEGIFQAFRLLGIKESS
jgi:adenylate cyclase